MVTKDPVLRKLNTAFMLKFNTLLLCFNVRIREIVTTRAGTIVELREK